MKNLLNTAATAVIFFFFLTSVLAQAPITIEIVEDYVIFSNGDTVLVKDDGTPTVKGARAVITKLQEFNVWVINPLTCDSDTDPIELGVFSGWNENGQHRIIISPKEYGRWYTRVGQSPKSEWEKAKKNEEVMTCDGEFLLKKDTKLRLNPGGPLVPSYKIVSKKHLSGSKKIDGILLTPLDPKYWSFADGGNGCGVFFDDDASAHITASDADNGAGANSSNNNASSGTGIPAGTYEVTEIRTETGFGRTAVTGYKLKTPLRLVSISGGELVPAKPKIYRVYQGSQPRLFGEINEEYKRTKRVNGVKTIQM